MRCLVTGASGWIGFAFVRQWVERHGVDSLQFVLLPEPQHELEAQRAAALKNIPCDVVVHDLLNTPFPADQIKDFDVLLHFAAFTSTESLDDKVYVNSEGTRNLLEALKEKLAGKRVIYFGSIASIDCYESTSGGFAESSSCNPITIYGKTKLQGEVILKELAQREGYDWTILRLPTVYGAGYRPGGLFDIIKRGKHHVHLFTRVQWSGELSLLYIDDLIELLIQLLEQDKARNSLLHVADPTSVAFATLFPPDQIRLPLPKMVARTIRFVSIRLIKTMPLPHSIFVSLWRLSHLLGESMVFDTSKAEKIFSLNYTPLQEGLQKTFENYQPGIE